MTDRASNLIHKRNKSQLRFLEDMWAAIYSEDYIEEFDPVTNTIVRRSSRMAQDTNSETVPQVDLEEPVMSDVRETHISGVKYDSGKVEYHLFPFETFDEINKVLMFGAGKYDPRNWEKGINFNRLFNSTLRHLFSWWRGEDLDPETNLSHLAHAATNVIFLLAFVLRGRTDLDNRPESIK